MDIYKIPELKKASLFKLWFWRKSQHASFEEAREEGAVYSSDLECDDYVSFLTVLFNVQKACECMEHNAHEDVMFRLTADGLNFGDFNTKGDSLK